MGQLTRTNFGIIKRTILTNAQIKALPTAPVVLVPAISGKAIFVQSAFLWLDWTADYGAIDAAATMGIYYATLLNSPVLTVLDEAVISSKVSYLLAEGESTTAMMLPDPYINVNGNAQNIQCFALAGFDVDKVVGTGADVVLKTVNGASVPFNGGDALNRLIIDVFYMVIDPPPAV